MAENNVDARSAKQKRGGERRGCQDAALARINASVGRDPLPGSTKGPTEMGDRPPGPPRAARGDR